MRFFCQDSAKNCRQVSNWMLKNTPFIEPLQYFQSQRQYCPWKHFVQVCIFIPGYLMTHNGRKIFFYIHRKYPAPLYKHHIGTACTDVPQCAVINAACFYAQYCRTKHYPHYCQKVFRLRKTVYILTPYVLYKILRNLSSLLTECILPCFFMHRTLTVI